MNITRRIVVAIGLVFVGLAGAAQADDVASLIKQLGSWSTDKAKKASDELAAMGKPVVPEVAKALRSRSRRRGRFAARALRQIGPDAAGAIPALSESLKDSDALTREYAVEALGKMAAQAERVIGILQQVSDDRDKDVREQARLAIARLTESLKLREQGESAPHAPVETAAQPNIANAGDSPAVLAASSAKKETPPGKLTPIVVIRFALIAFVVVGFFSLLYVNREHS
jgi:HEAT repeat protein